MVGLAPFGAQGGFLDGVAGLGGGVVALDGLRLDRYAGGRLVFAFVCLAEKIARQEQAGGDQQQAGHAQSNVLHGAPPALRWCRMRPAMISSAAHLIQPSGT